MSSSYVHAECGHYAQPQHWLIELIITTTAIGYAVWHYWSLSLVVLTMLGY